LVKGQGESWTLSKSLKERGGTLIKKKRNQCLGYPKVGDSMGERDPSTTPYQGEGVRGGGASPKRFSGLGMYGKAPRKEQRPPTG